MAFEKNKFADGWKIIKFRDCIIQLNTGLNPRDNFSLGKGNIKYITAKNLSQSGTIDFSTCDYIDQKAKDIIHKRSDIQKGDILFASRAPIGHSYLIKEEPVDFDIGESIFCIRVNNDVVLPEYLCLYLSSAFFIKMASKRVTGSVIQEIRIGDLLDTDVIIPPRKTQQNISLHIDAIDRKIALNKSICSDLESMAKLLYDYWFVQFDFPDENGRPYKSSGGKMVWNEELKRKIPEGWEVKTFGSLCAMMNGINYDKNEIGDKEYQIVNVRNITASSLLMNEVEFDSIVLKKDSADKYIVNNDDILIARSGTPGAVRLVQSPSENVIFCGFIIRCAPYENTHRLYLSYFMKTLEGTSATKTGGSILQNVSQDTLGRVAIYVPPKDIIDAFNEHVSKIHSGIQNAIEENQQLASLRDFLLPMLMNGQVKVVDKTSEE